MVAMLTVHGIVLSKPYTNGKTKPSKEKPMDNGCPKCEKLGEYELCFDHRLAQAEHDVLRDMNIVEELKKEKEQENEPRRI